tara:strand:- start:197 stop:421 length:225 start_codon:yes stop_codon:yes gene_type:complete
MKCLEECKNQKKPCENEACRMWVDYPGEYNCVYETIDRNGSLTLREVGKRLKVSFARIKQIETEALGKVKLLLK